MINISADAMPINSLSSEGRNVFLEFTFPIIVEGGEQVGEWSKEAESADCWDR
jgi:N6-adenosine-specific RNA methylase IME4